MFLEELFRRRAAGDEAVHLHLRRVARACAHGGGGAGAGEVRAGASDSKV